MPLTPCPACNSEMTYQETPPPVRYGIKCPVCGYQGAGLYQTKDAAEMDWEETLGRMEEAK